MHKVTEDLLGRLLLESPFPYEHEVQSAGNESLDVIHLHNDYLLTVSPHPPQTLVRLEERYDSGNAVLEEWLLDETHDLQPICSAVVVVMGSR